MGLSSLRTSIKSSLTFKIILGMAILLFALLGVNSFFDISNQQNIDVLTIDGKNISYSKFSQSYSTVQNQIRQNYGDVDFENPQIQKILLEETVRRITYDVVLNNYIQHEDNLYLINDNKKVYNFIKELSIFKDEKGHFDPTLAKSYAFNNNFSEAQFIELMSGEYGKTKFMEILNDTSYIPKKEIENFKKISYQTRSASLLNISNEYFINDIKISKKAKEKFYNENKNQYKTPETISIRYIKIDEKSIAQNIKIDKKLVEKELKKELSQPQKEQSVSHIFVDKNLYTQEELEKKINNIKSKLTTDNFEQIVKDYSDDEASILENGKIAYEPGVFSEEFDEAIDNLNVNQVTENAVESEFGFHFLKLNSSKKIKINKKKLRKSIIKKMQLSQAIELNEQYTTKINEQLYTGASFDDIYQSLENKNIKVVKKTKLTLSQFSLGLGIKEIAESKKIFEEIKTQAQEKNNTELRFYQYGEEPNITAGLIEVRGFKASKQLTLKDKTTNNKIKNLLINEEANKKLSIFIDKNLNLLKKGKISGDQIIKKLIALNDDVGNTAKWEIYENVNRTTENIPAFVKDYLFRLNFPKGTTKPQYHKIKNVNFAVDGILQFSSLDINSEKTMKDLKVTNKEVTDNLKNGFTDIVVQEITKKLADNVEVERNNSIFGQQKNNQPVN